MAPSIIDFGLTPTSVMNSVNVVVRINNNHVQLTHKLKTIVNAKWIKGAQFRQ